MAPKNKINLKDRFENGELDLSMSDLQEVPVKEIATVKKATSLDLSNNRLTTLGKTFVTLNHIIKLDLSKNQLRELPEDFGAMSQLKHLDLYSNQVSHLPLSLCELKGLRWLDLKNNPLVPALAHVVGPCLDAQQCQQSARATVAFLGEMRARVEEERDRLRQQQQRELEAQQDKERQQRKRNDRKKAARAKKKEFRREAERDPLDEELLDEPAPQEVLGRATAAVTPRGRVWSRCWMLLLVLPVLLLVLNRNTCQEHLVLGWQRLVEALPEQARPSALRLAHYLNELATLVAVLYDNVRDVVTEASRSRHVHSSLEMLSQAFHVARNQSTQIFRTLSEKVFVLTDQITKKLV